MTERFEGACGECFALCCVALSFQRSADFGHDKPSGQACHFLQDDFRCRIHAQKEDLGYEGCLEFDCFGAGQRASAGFAGSAFRSDPSVARQLYARFAQLLKLQELRQALVDAEELGLPPGLETERVALVGGIGAAADQLRDSVDPDAPKLIAAAESFIDRLKV